MEISSDGFVYTDEAKKKLKEEFENWSPSTLQRIIWIIWPTMKLIRWKRYKAMNW